MKHRISHVLMKTWIITTAVIATTITAETQPSEQPLSLHAEVTPNVHVAVPGQSTVWVSSGRGRTIRWWYADKDCAVWRVTLLTGQGQLGGEFEARVGEHVVQDQEVHQFTIRLPETIPSGQYKIQLSCSIFTNGGKTKIAQGVSQMFAVLGFDLLRANSTRNYTTEYVDNLNARHQKIAAFYSRADGSTLWPVNRDQCDVPRLHRPSREEFEEKCARPQQACVVTGVMQDWPGMHRWQFSAMRADQRLAPGLKIGHDDLRVNFSTWDDWRNSSKALSHWQQPMIFNHDIFDKFPALLQDFTVPETFSPDNDFMMNVKDELRLPWRWMIFAARRSGSMYHVDPCNTTAWLGLAAGHKRWGFFPPATHFIPGMTNNNYMERNYQVHDAFHWYSFTFPYLRPARRPAECVQRPGDITYLPAGWWHGVLNLEDTAAVTHNFVDKHIFSQFMQELINQTNPESPALVKLPTTLKTLYSESHAEYFPSAVTEYREPSAVTSREYTDALKLTLARLLA